MITKKRFGKVPHQKLRRSKYFFLFLILILIECGQKTTKKQEIEHCLTGESEKYWTYLYEYPIKHYLGRVYKKDGTYVTYSNLNRIGRIVVRGNNSTSEWKVINDSIFEEEGFKYRIEYINDDIFVMTKLSEPSSIIVMYKSEDQSTKPTKDTIKYKYPDF